MRVVLDANTIISGLFWQGLPSQVYQAALDNRFTLLSSVALISELEEVLHRPKFAIVLSKAKKTPELILSAHHEHIELVTPAEIPENAVRDPKDRIVLACAVGGKADFIVSGDKDLLVLDSYDNIPILTAEQFLECLTNSDE